MGYSDYTVVDKVFEMKHIAMDNEMEIKDKSTMHLGSRDRRAYSTSEALRRCLVDINQLLYFQKVAELQHMTKAAEELNISQGGAQPGHTQSRAGAGRAAF